MESGVNDKNVQDLVESHGNKARICKAFLDTTQHERQKWPSFGGVSQKQSTLAVSSRILD
jgi:hypothetical protein